MSSSNDHLGYKQVANVERRRWDVEAYEKKAAERKQRELEEQEGSGGIRSPQHHRQRGGQTSPDTKSPHKKEDDDDDDKPEFQPAARGAAGPEGSQRAFLQARKGRVGDIDDRVGSKDMVSVEEAAAASNKDAVVKKTGVGWHCSVCDCFLKDSHTYLDHINGRKHQRALGFSMRVERSTESDLMGKLGRLQQEKKKKQASEQEDIVVNYDKLVKDRDEEERLRKEERQRKRKERRKLQKQKEKGSDEPQPEQDDNEEEEETETDETGGIDPDMAAMMGFSGFGTTKS